MTTQARPQANCSQSRNSRRNAGNWLVLVASCGLALAACDEQDPTLAALERARLALDKISLPATPLPETGGTDAAEGALARVVADLRPITTSGTAGQKQAASLLVAQAQLGIADRRAALATLAEREAMGSLTPIRAKIDGMLSEASRSTALLSYDPSASISQLQALITSKDAEVSQRQRDRAQIEADILLLRQGAEERMAMGAAKREEAARLAVQAMALPAAESAVLMGDVHRIRREADKIELDGADLLARADVRQPELAERQLMVDQVVNQKAELEAALAATRARATQSRTLASEHASAAAVAATQLNEMIEGVLSHRTGTANPRIDAAVEAYAAAQTSARAAGNDGFALIGSSAQGRGDMLWLRAQNLHLLADTLDQLATMSVPPALTPADRDALQGTLRTYAQRATELRTAQRQALAAAAEAYGEARDSFQRVKGDDDASRARVNRLAQLMHLCRQAANGAAIDISTITDEPGDFTEETPAAPDADQPAGNAPQGNEPSASASTGDPTRG